MSDLPNLPETFAAIPYYKLRYARSSPVHPFLNYVTHASDSDSLPKIQAWIKREDQASPFVCCGNKYRKLEYVIPDVLADPNVTTVVTEGGLQSNHAVQTAVVAAQLGKECVLLLDESSGGLQSSKNKDIFRGSGNVQVEQLLGAQLHVHQGSQPKESVLDRLRSEGKVPYWIPGGASLHPLGGLGYARCAFEIAAQERDLGLPGSGCFDYVFTACGGGSTLAGLIAGFELLDETSGIEGRRTSRQLIGIMVSAKTAFEERVLSIAQRAGALIGLSSAKSLTLDNVRLDQRFVGSGYGNFDPEVQETLRLTALRDGILMDPVYTGRALTGMLHWIKSGELQHDYEKQGGETNVGVPDVLNVLFLHTGGQTVYSAYSTPIEKLAGSE